MMRAPGSWSGLAWSRASCADARRPLILLLTLTAGCGSGAQSPQTYVVRDSADIRIVESSEAAWGPGEAWTVSPQPVLHIGVIDGEEEYRFTVISGPNNHHGVWQQGDGTIVAADASTAQLRRYARDGTFLNLWGGRGDGPTEFRSLQAFPYRGDSIVVVDNGRRRYVLYDTEGTLGRSVPAPVVETSTSGGTGITSRPLQFISTFGDGTFMGMLSPIPVIGAGLRPPQVVSFSRYSAEGDLMDTIGDFPMPDAVPFDPGAVISVPFGQPFTYVAGEGSLYVGRVDGFEITRISLADGRESRIRSSHLDLTTTEADREGFRESTRFQATMNNRDLPSVERALLEVVYPETIPAFSQLLEDSEGYLWVRHFKLRWSTGPEEWSVFDPEGYLLGTVETPEALQVRQIGPDFIAGIWTDELDVRYLRKYALTR